MPRERMTFAKLQQKKTDKSKIAMLVLYDYQMAGIADERDVDLILVGDSFGPVVLGHRRMNEVTMAEMLHHCRAVARGADGPIVIGDMPFMSERESIPQALRNAGRLIREGLCDAVKIDGNISATTTIKAIAAAEIPIMGQIGATHQTEDWNPSGGLFGGDRGAADELLETALAFEEAGAFAVAVAFVPPELARKISESLRIPVIGAGSGPWCDGQSATVYDLLGIARGETPPHLKRYAELRGIIGDAFGRYVSEVRSRQFP